MAQFTPSALTVQSMGYMNLTIAHVNEDTISGTNYWSTGITDIRSIMVCQRGGTAVVASSNAISVTWTQTSGVLHIVSDVSMSNAGYAIWIASGGPAVLS